ncbi:MAG: hypothetical protein HOV83_25180 [Catenulispora sp.]|nr:hypothetical protein [Catenulispora sp.]
MTTLDDRRRDDEETLAERVRKLEQQLTERDTTIANQAAEIGRLRGEHGRGR